MARLVASVSVLGTRILGYKGGQERAGIRYVCVEAKWASMGMCQSSRGYHSSMIGNEKTVVQYGLVPKHYSTIRSSRWERPGELGDQEDMLEGVFAGAGPTSTMVALGRHEGSWPWPRLPHLGRLQELNLVGLLFIHERILTNSLLWMESIDYCILDITSHQSKQVSYSLPPPFPVQVTIFPT